MRTLIGSIGFAVVAALAVPAAAQTAATVAAKGPGVASAVQTAKATATIKGIEAATRAVTLRLSGGRELVLTAGPEVRNFAQLKVGDKVDVEYVEALTIELKKASTAPVARTEQSVVAGAKPGERPAGMAGTKVTITAEVVNVNEKKQIVTLRGPQRTVKLKVADPEQFKLVAKGDRVVATYTEAVAIAVAPAKAAEPAKSAPAATAPAKSAAPATTAPATKK